MRKSRNQPTCKILSRKLWFWRDLLKMVDTRQQLKEHSWQINYGEILSFPFWAGLGFLSKGGFNRFSLWYTFQLIFFNVFSKYASLLSSQGSLQTAMVYLSAVDDKVSQIRLRFFSFESYYSWMILNPCISEHLLRWTPFNGHIYHEWIGFRQSFQRKTF